MRLIDADALKDMMLSAYNDALPEFDMPWKKKMAHSVTLSFMADIDEAPTVDAVPVVRCRDCVYGSWFDGYVCSHPEIRHLCNPDEFCSKGERREEEQE